MNMTARVRAKPSPEPSFTPVRTNLLQRKCACGGTPGLDGECAGCRKKRLARQARSTSQAEPYEAPPIVHEVLRSPGRPLDADARSFMESRFGHGFGRVRVHAGAPTVPQPELTINEPGDIYEQEADRLTRRFLAEPAPAAARGAERGGGYDFGQVRVHTGVRAAESARAVGARAYTVGRHIVFGEGQYAPRSSEGRRLLTHELTHVVQQDGIAGAYGAPVQRRSGGGGRVQRAVGVCEGLANLHFAATGKDNAPVCAPPPQPREVGSTVETEIAQIGGYGASGPLLKEVLIPGANKAALRDEDPNEDFGYADLVEVSDRNTYLEVRLAEIKPLNVNGLRAAGEEARHYLDKIQAMNEDVGCDADPMDLSLPANRSVRTFCNKLGLAGVQKQVRLADPPFITWAPAPFPASFDPPGRVIEVYNCGQGAINYRCRPKEQDERTDESPWYELVGTCLLEGVAGEFIHDPGWCGIILDTCVSLVPYADQVADARDVVAHVYWISYAGEYDSPGRWVSLLFTLLGLIPEAGSAIKGLSKVAQKTLREAAPEMRDVVLAELRRLSDELGLDALRKEFAETWPMLKAQATANFNALVAALIAWVEDLRKRARDAGALLALKLALGAGEITQLVVELVSKQLDELLLKLRPLQTDGPRKLEESADFVWEQFQSLERVGEAVPVPTRAAPQKVQQ